MEGTRRLVSTLDLPFETIGKLLHCGYRRVEDLEDVEIQTLATELKVAQHVAAEVMTKAMADADGSGADDGILQAKSGEELVAEQKAAPSRIVTFSKAIDTVIGGGMRIGQLTEIHGTPGVGKTQICMQLAVDVQIPQSFGGVGGAAVYIDTEGGFMAERMAEIADAVLSHLDRVAQTKKNADHARDVKAMSRAKLLRNVHVFRCLDDADLLAVLEHLPAFLTQHPQVRLLLVDSLTFPFRQDRIFQTEDNIKRTRIISTVARELNQLAVTHKLAVVVVNQMTNKILDGVDPNGPPPLDLEHHPRLPIVPSLGDSWAPVCATKLYLWLGRDCLRRATLIKSSTNSRKTVTFRISAPGIRDDPFAQKKPITQPKS